MTIPGLWLIGPFLALYALLTAGALIPSLAAVVVAALGLHLCEMALKRIPDRQLVRYLQRLQAGLGVRTLLRLLLLTTFIVRSGQHPAWQAGLVVFCSVLHQVARLLLGALTSIVNTRRRRRAETRNIDVPGTELPPAPRDALLLNGQSSLVLSDLLLIATLAWALVSGSSQLIVPGAVAMALVALAFPAWLIWPALRLGSVVRGVDQYHLAVTATQQLSPEVIMYFSGGARDTYQVDTWLRTLELLDRPVLVLLRERAVFAALAPTTLPVLCLPGAADVLNLTLPSARVALFAANVGKNIHLLREPDLMSVFIGHGDSDKTASFNPFTKVYDEVWVAGEAGRDRYRRAAVGIRDEQVVVVGRPQLDGLHQAEPRSADEGLTVLYAPTWEGWTEDPHHSSIATMGENIVQTLLASERVRVLFKPHPRTGSVDPAAARALDRIVALLTTAGAPHAAVLDDRLSLYECFDAADALVSDVSSVVSDFLASEKPYFVANGAGLPTAEFRSTYASAAAAYVVGPGAAGLSEGLADLRGRDTMKAARREVRTYLLGSSDVPSLSRFRAAADALAARARRGHHSGAEIPENVLIQDQPDG